MDWFKWRKSLGWDNRIGVFLTVLALPAVLVLACGTAAQESGGGEADPSGTGSMAVTTASSPATTSETDSGSSSELEQLAGDIAIDGSSTVFPITEAVAEEFGILTGGKVRITVGISGTGGGFKKFCNNETVITDASRPIKASEVMLCADAGVEYIEIPVAIDGLTE